MGLHEWSMVNYMSKIMTSVVDGWPDPFGQVTGQVIAWSLTLGSINSLMELMVLYCSCYAEVIYMYMHDHDDLAHDY